MCSTWCNNSDLFGEILCNAITYFMSAMLKNAAAAFAKYAVLVPDQPFHHLIFIYFLLSRLSSMRDI